jgi:hypothetical protein
MLVASCRIRVGRGWLVYSVYEAERENTREARRNGGGRLFSRCGFAVEHDGSTRKWWTKDRLAELNQGAPPLPDLPADGILAILAELLDPDDFRDAEKDVAAALAELNASLKREALVVFVDDVGRCHVRNTGSGSSSSDTQPRRRPLSREEVLQRDQLATFLDRASEDELTERLLVPFFQRLGFIRVRTSQQRHRGLRSAAYAAAVINVEDAAVDVGRAFPERDCGASRLGDVAQRVRRRTAGRSREGATALDRRLRSAARVAGLRSPGARRECLLRVRRGVCGHDGLDHHVRLTGAT